jgi:hyaluronoglucosaminidase
VLLPPRRWLPLLPLLAGCTDAPSGGGKPDGVDLGFPPFRSGVIEGFYGEVYEAATREALLRDVAELGMNTWVYGPKSDPLHRARWREPYDSTWLDAFGALGELGEASGVELCFALSPGLDIVYSDEEDMDALLAKYEEVAARGVTCFALFLDDIVGALRDDDAEAFGSVGEAHVHAVRRVRSFVATLAEDADLIFCPTEYAWSNGSDYLRTISALPEDVEIFWTGPEVVSPEITASSARAAERTLARPALLWDNFPVNDFAPELLFLGPLSGREAGAVAHLSGLLFNPMIEARASRVALGTAAAFLADPAAYDEAEAWHEALALVGEGAVDDFTVFASLCRTSRLDPAEPEPLSSLLDAFLATGVSGPEALALREALTEVAGLADTLPGALADGALALEILPWVEKASALGEAALGALDDWLALLDPLLPDPVEAWMRRLAWQVPAESLLADDAHVVADSTFERLFTAASTLRLDQALRLGTDAPLTPSTSLETRAGYGLERAFDGDARSSWWSDRTPGAGDFLAVDLGETLPIRAVYLDQDAQDHLRDGRLQISEDGLAWTEVASFGEPFETWIPAAPTSARFLRLEALAPQAETWRIFEVAIVTLDSWAPLGIETDLPSALRPEYAVDRKTGHAWVSDRAPGAGERFTLSLASPAPISELILLSPAGAALEGAELHALREGGDWELQGSLRGIEAQRLGLGEGRWSSLRIDFPHDAPAALQIGEILVSIR